MNGNKLFAASIAILALALGFFLGTLKGSCCAPCEHSAMNAPCDCTKGLPCSCEKNGQPCHCPNCAKHDHKGPHGDFDKGPKFRGKMDFAAMDSLLQVTPEQKAAIEASRVKGDSIFKVLRQQKHEAERALGEALESKDAAGIDAAKAKVLEADKALLEHRINGMQALAGILTAEQLEKFNNFHKEQMKHFKERMKNGPKGPGPHPGMGHGPHHN
ncbi:Spy/CpxP family protein refolding chaperone [Fibrobacter sp.]|uniref:Spy/CpxP family protein refolding chaperone n=1 Tax=Fibrobacter sp. TaxID=35828 RepID=UPI003865EE7F